ncbi:MAG: hypothetical protein IJO62_01235 [Clostridia bacterium]|nr:hypothetical protein [Clostridia bacterium]
MSFKKIFILSLMAIFGFLLIINPEICKEGVTKAIILSGRILIPSLFPFSVCVLYIMKSGIIDKIQKFIPLNFIIMFFSMLGGYPIGAKLVSEAVSNKEITPENGRKMLNYCVNAGPAFIVSAVGGGLIGSKKIGYILLVSHILASLIICLFSEKLKTNNNKLQKISSISDNFVISASESANAVISICGFVILFSVIVAYIEFFALKYPFLRPLLYLAEVTTAITKTRNIYLISFLLGFSGLCIWCQVLSVAKKIRIKLKMFCFFRILHGIISLIITFTILKIFPVKLPTYSNINFVIFKPVVSNVALGVSLLILGIIFIISLITRQNSAKILEEIV